MSAGRRVVAVVQARTTSTRLPRKVLARIGDCTMIERLLRQISGCPNLAKPGGRQARPGRCAPVEQTDSGL